MALGIFSTARKRPEISYNTEWKWRLNEYWQMAKHLLTIPTDGQKQFTDYLQMANSLLAILTNGQK